MRVKNLILSYEVVHKLLAVMVTQNIRDTGISYRMADTALIHMFYDFCFMY